MFTQKTYHIVTFGCQMNKSDSERVAGMLDVLGAQEVATAAHADIVVFMTCCVREAADVRLLGQVASLKNAGAIIAVGGCIGQRDGALLAQQLPHVSVIFGTHNIAHLPQLLTQALETGKPQIEVVEAAEPNSDSTPVKRAQHWHAWLPIMTGCNNFCSYCVVPYVRGRERSRPFDEITREASELVAGGVKEITLLGQNVNSYGRDLYQEPRFAQVLEAVGTSGVERLRFATSHPKDLSAQTIAAFAQIPAVMPALHLPVQSGSDAVLAAMNRNYTAAHYLDLIDQVRTACTQAGKPPVAFSTDVIVGFPGETQANFEATLALVEQVGYAQAFTFIYSKRDGTPAAKMADETPHEIIQERFEQLVEVVQAGAWTFNQQMLGKTIPVLFEGTSKRDASMLAGKSPQNITVHAPLPQGTFAQDYAGTTHLVTINEAKTWYLRGTLQ